MSDHLSLKACLVGIAFSALTTASIGDARHAGDAAASAAAPASMRAVETVELQRVVIHARRQAAPMR